VRYRRRRSSYGRSRFRFARRRRGYPVRRRRVRPIRIGYRM